MSPTSYQAAPPRINTLSNRPLISVYLKTTWQTQALPWCHHHKLRRGSIGTAATAVNPHKLGMPGSAHGALLAACQKLVRGLKGSESRSTVQALHCPLGTDLCRLDPPSNWVVSQPLLESLLGWICPEPMACSISYTRSTPT